MPYIAITSFKCVSRVSDKEFEGDALENAIDSFKDDLRALFANHGFDLASVESTFVNEKKYSIEQCQSCGNILINRDNNPAGYEGEFIGDIIINGGLSGGMALCERCLPKEHRWSCG